MQINEIIRRYQPLFEQAGEGGGGGAGGDAGEGADVNGGKGGDDNSAGDPDAVLNAHAAQTGDDTAGAGDAPDDVSDTADDKSGKDDDKSGKGEDDKDGDDAAQDTVPEDGKYEFEVPEGMELDEAMAEAMSPLFKELGITQAQANQLVATYGAQVQERAEAEAQTFVDRVTGWTDAAKADKEIGNDNWDASVAAGNAALQKFGTPELTQALGETGMSNHPEVIRFMVRVAKAVGDDKLEPGDNVDIGGKPPEEVWYGDTTPTTKKG